MKSMKALFIVATLTVSSFAMAEGGADRVFAQVAQAQQRSVESYQVAQKTKADAEVVDSQSKSATHSNC